MEYLKIPKNISITTLYDLMKFGFIENYNEEKATSEKFVKTYGDKDFTNLACKSAKRSFEDLLDISRTYFPETTEKELALVLEQLRINHGLFCLYCPDIEKTVFYTNHRGYTSFRDGQYENYRDKLGNSQYCLNDILKLIET